MNSSNHTDTDIFTQAEKFQPALYLERLVSFRSQRRLVFAAVCLLVASGVSWLVLSYIPGVHVASRITGLAAVVSILMIIALLVLLPLYGFYTYFRFSGLDAESDSSDPATVMTFPAATVLVSINRVGSLSYGFLSGRFGQLVATRAEANLEPLLESVSADSRNSGRLSEILDTKDRIDLVAVVTAILEVDDQLSEAFLSQGVSKRTVVLAAGWVQRSDRRFCRSKWFWSRRHLSSIQSLSANFSYGQAHTLKRFSHSGASHSAFLSARNESDAFGDAVNNTISILTRPRDTNALLVGLPAAGVSDIIAIIRQRLRDRTVPEPLRNRTLYILDQSALISVTENKARLEQLLTKLLVEATNAGNVLLVIENIVSFRQQCRQLGVDLFSILDTFLDRLDLPIIATAEPRSYHSNLEGRSITSEFGTVSVEGVDKDSLLTLLSAVARNREGKAVFTIPALEAISSGARKLLDDRQEAHAAVNLLLEINSLNPGAHITITKAVVNEYLSKKTGVPVGSVTDQERQDLASLEDRLHQRVVGQDEAVTAVSSALRRRRSGVDRDDRPIGSFLFLGPTGVGKTETAKTLARIYFDGVESMTRMDMSEYSRRGALGELIGDPGESGRLANVISDSPYGLLLLDEFEKANSEVHDLFLQILDEGFFTDGSGRRVYLDNMIIIATSNAGAADIFSLVDSGGDLSSKSDKIIDDLITDGTFRPELLNRFDSTVVYHPLSLDDLRAVTAILLDELAERLQQRGFRLQLDDGIIGYIVDTGYDPKFGARAIRRVIQDSVEDAVAEKILTNSLEPGDTIHLAVGDLDNSES